jgi:hypothetical protein
MTTLDEGAVFAENLEQTTGMANTSTSCMVSWDREAQGRTKEEITCRMPCGVEHLWDDRSSNGLRKDTGDELR